MHISGQSEALKEFLAPTDLSHSEHSVNSCNGSLNQDSKINNHIDGNTDAGKDSNNIQPLGDA